MYKVLSQVLGGLAVLVSLSFVGYELKRNNDLAVVQSQHQLLELQVGMKATLADPNTLQILMTQDFEDLNDEEQLLFIALVSSWFDLFEAAFLAQERGILTNEQAAVWRNGLCTLPVHWLEAFGARIYQNNFLDEVVEGVRDCLSSSSQQDTGGGA